MHKKTKISIGILLVIALVASALFLGNGKFFTGNIGQFSFQKKTLNVAQQIEKIRQNPPVLTRTSTPVRECGIEHYTLNLHPYSPIGSSVGGIANEIGYFIVTTTDCRLNLDNIHVGISAQGVSVSNLKIYQAEYNQNTLYQYVIYEGSNIICSDDGIQNVSLRPSSPAARMVVEPGTSKSFIVRGDVGSTSAPTGNSLITRIMGINNTYFPTPPNTDLMTYGPDSGVYAHACL